MQINSILPVLLQLIMTDEQNQAHQSKPSLTPFSRLQTSQSSPHSRTNQTLTSIKGQPVNKSTAVEGINQSFSNQSIVNRENPEAQNQLIFNPLPLKSEIFPDAKFYKQIIRDKEHKNSGDNQNRLVFGLKTPSLGELYFLVIQQENNLSIKCAASRRQTTLFLNQEFKHLKENLQRSGWAKINCLCIYVENPGQLPGITPSGFINLKI